MKVYLIALCLLFSICAADAAPNTLDTMYIGTYHAVAHSTDLGKVWVASGEIVGTFNESYLTLNDGYHIPYLRVLYSDYDKAHYTFIQINYNDIIEITDIKPGMIVLQYLQNGKEIERYICRIDKVP